MTKRKSLTVLTVAFAIFIIMGMAAITAEAQTLVSYNADNTLAYAKAHYNDATEADGTKQDCIHFAKDCVEKGGVPKDTERPFGYSVQEYVEYATSYGYAQLNKLITEQTAGGQYIPVEGNEGKVAPGDILIYKCTNASCAKKYFHASVCGEVVTKSTGTEGKEFYTCYGHNTNTGEKPALKIKCMQCGAAADTIDMYALHITSAANGFSAYTDKVTNLKAEGTAYNQIKLSWTAVPGATSYNILGRANDKSAYKLVGTSATNTFTWTVSGSYGPKDMKVVPCKAAQNGNIAGTPVKVSGATAAAAPANLKAKLTKYDSVKVTWGQSTGATGYIVYYKIGTGKWIRLATQKETSLSKKFGAGKNLTFKIVPYQVNASTGASTKYATAKITTLKVPSGLALKWVNKKTVKVKWKNIPGETGYQISKSKKKGGTSVVATVKTTTGTSKNITAKKGVKYFYKVRAYKTVGTKKIYTPWTTAAAFKL